MTDIADILDRAADLIEPKGAWIQGASARTADGRHTIPNAIDAKCFCADGAIARAAADWGEQQGALRKVQGLIRKSLWRWNDRPGRTQAEVVAKLREAARKARGESA